MNKLFKFVREEQSHIGVGENTIDNVVNLAKAGAQSTVDGKSDRLVPDGGPVIDIVKNFKWTKTKRNSVGRENTPTLELQEFYVPLPAFYSNLNVAKQIADSAGRGIGGIMDQIATIAGSPASVTGAVQNVKGVTSSGSQKAQALIDKANSAFGVEEMKMPQYLKAYENLYGVKRSNFIYRLPYLEDKYKSINNNWQIGGGALNQAITDGTSSLTQLLGSLGAPAVGIDFSKSFNYPKDGPEHTMSFYLDNTKDSNYSGSPDVQLTGRSVNSQYDLNVGLAATHIPNYETNYRFIFLLLYQNMPNKLNRVALTPPVIYRAKLPGVFSYRYSFLSRLEVSMIGTRKNKTISGFINTENNKNVQAVIPEGYEVKLTLKSLVPETQNMYFDAINNPVFSTQG